MEQARFCRRCGAEPGSRSRPLSELVAQELGSGYRILGELGRGGFAVVYCVDEVHEPHRRLAVKVMRRELMLSSVLVGRFRREIQLASRLDHPRILPVLFTGERGNLVYYAMPRVRGQSLKDLLRRRGRVAVPEAAHLLREMAHGLRHAHEQGVIHRDVKPSNVMVGEDGNPILLDFGLARALAPHGGTLTVSGEVIGSPQYMSPEQAMGDRRLDQATDVYSWGLIAYEMLVGRPAFEASTMQEIMQKHLTERPAPVDAFHDDVPPTLARLIQETLEPSRANRRRDFSSVLQTLAEVG